MTDAVLLFDSVAWYDEDGDRQEADGKGTTVDLPGDEFDRLEELGAVAKPGSKAVKALAGAEPEPEISDEVAALIEEHDLKTLRKMAKDAGSTASMPTKVAAAEALIAAEG
jgi:hypothetical protein